MGTWRLGDLETGNEENQEVKGSYFFCKNTTDTALSNTGKPIAVWQSPEFEEFDLCMEVTAYVQQWD